ncbi:phosphotransferase family protein [Saccharibacillus sp. O23]|uniref:phosphotransferase family protein n=1 Tax=Saccharibacillus sp. O23 TaxID=2009338 RepID=UPI0015C5C752|nr:phosphotransferase [Saccharibacillus sp. O23]
MSNPFMQRLQDAYPQMIIADVQTERSAQHYFVFTVNHSAVFRFARDAESARSLLFEARSLLPAIARAVALPTPEPLYESLERLEPGYAFLGYARIDGEPLWPETLEEQAGTEAWERAAQSVSRFLRELHAAEPPRAEQGRREDAHADRLAPEELAARAREELFPRLSAGAREAAARDLEALASESERAGRQALIHGALGPAHLLWDAVEASVCGAIGFGSARTGDPARDLGSLSAVYGTAFYERCIALYAGDEALDKRARLYARLMPLQEALYGLDTGDDETLNYGLEAYERETGRCSGQT